MVAFAQFSDVQDRSPVPIDESQEARVNALLTDAATLIKRYCRQTFVVEQTVERLRPIGGKIRLPHLPVISVDAVAVIDYLQNRVPVAAPYWDGGDEIWLLYGQAILNLAEGLRELFQYNTPLCEVTYTHGYETFPDELVAVSCSVTLRRLAVPGAGVTQSQTAGPFSVALTPDAAAGSLWLTAAEKAMLADFRIKNRTMELR